MLNSFARGLIATTAVVLCSSPVVAQCQRWTAGPVSIPDPNPNGSVLAMTTWDPDSGGPVEPLLVIGGTFTSVGGVAANRIAAFNGFRWMPLGSGFNSDVRALVSFNSQLYAGGDFTSAGGVAVNHIAHWNGFTWQNLGTGTAGGSNSGRVSALAAFNSELIVGGSFTAAGGLATNCIARWNGTTWAGMGSGMAISGNTPRVECLAVFEGQLYAGGFFTSVSGVQANNIARWNGSAWSKLGFVNFTNNGADGLVRCFLVDDFGGTTGELLVVGGSFTQVSTGLVTTDSPAVAFWSGSNWFAAGPGLPGATVGGLADASFGFIAGGFFPGPFNSIAHYIQSVGQWEPLDGGIELGSVQCMVNYDHQFAGEQIWVGGAFQGAGGLNVNNLVEVNDVEFEFLPSDLGFIPFAFANVGSRLIASGYGALYAGSNALDNIMAWNGQNLSPLGTGLNGFATSMVARVDNPSQTSLFVGGAFSIAGNVAASNVARWTENTTTFTGNWSAMGTGFNSDVLAIERVAANSIINESVYAGGVFTASGNGATAFNRVALWDVPSSTWFPMGTGFNGGVFALKGFNTSSFGRDVIAGGNFTTASGVAANRVALWRAPNQNGWTPMGNGFNGSVFDIERHNGSTYACGSFTHSGNGVTPLNHVARWTGTTWEQVGAGLPSSVGALLSRNGNLYAVMSDQNRALMKWDGSTWTVLRSGPQSVDGSTNMYALAAYHDEIHVGGTFDTVNSGNVSPRWARYLETGAPWIAKQPISQAKPCGAHTLFTVGIAVGYPNVTYAWRRDGVPLSNGATGHGSIIGGADTAGLHILNLQNQDAGEYECVVANECGSETSAIAVLVILNTCCPGDVTGDQVINIDDLLAVVNAWGPCPAPPAQCLADIAPPGGSGVVDIDDLLAVINGWGACR